MVASIRARLQADMKLVRNIQKIVMLIDESNSHGKTPEHTNIPSYDTHERTPRDQHFMKGPTPKLSSSIPGNLVPPITSSHTSMQCITLREHLINIDVPAGSLRCGQRLACLLFGQPWSRFYGARSRARVY
eukprot:7169502-Pyramimonas_sp.AAC.1